jgi:5'-methylthioadenosine phosphorylase
MFSKFGEVVGMTLFPEVVLAREKGICYAALCLVSNWCAGLQESLSVKEILSIYEEKKDQIMKILDECIKAIPEKRNCKCANAFERGLLK